MIDFSNFNSLVEIALYFDTPAKCKKAIAQSRWADGDVVCPYSVGALAVHPFASLNQSCQSFLSFLVSSQVVIA